MTMDMSQFHGVFLEESAEHLDEIEHLLMALSVDEPDIEELNCIFRAAHSIKGGAGIFGFDALISVTHIMENLFDKARQRQFVMTQPVVNELLAVVDTLRQLLACYGDGAAIDWQLVAQATARIETLLQSKAPADAEQGFGFFTEPSPVTDHSFGFFHDEPTATDHSTAGTASSVDTAAVETTAIANPAGGYAGAVSAADEGFGFFTEPVCPSPALAAGSQPVLPEPAAAVQQHADGQPASAPAKSAAKPKADTDAGSIRVDLHKIDSLVNLVGELVITQSMLTLIGDELAGPLAERLSAALRELERNTRDLQEGIMSIRMLPMSFVFNRFPRVVRDLSQKLQKTVDLVVEGGQTEIDKSLIEKLVDPLTHLVRNSLDHGIEAPEVRLARGKPATGKLTLRAEQKGGNILISVLDDGAGLNREKILAKARQRDIEISDNAPDNEVWQLIMAPGFSTAEQVTDVSGRGVGMDVVKRNIEAMGGKIEISSVAGLGSGMHIRLPLTLAIVDGMSVSVGQQQFIVPLVNIVESVQPSAEQLTSVSNQQMLFLRDLYWPIVRLGELMQLPGALAEPTTAILVLVESSRNRFAMLVDDLLGQQQVVIKSLEQHYRRVDGVAGATIMGDGSVALILDVESLAGIPGMAVH